MGLSDILAYTMFESAEKMAEMSSRQLLRKLKDNDCTELRQRGSHLQVKCGGCQSTVPMHGAGDIAKGTLRSIEKSLGVCLGDNWTKIEDIQTEAAPQSGSSFGGGDFEVSPGPSARPTVIRTPEDANGALQKAKKERRSAVRERDQAVALSSVQDEIVSEYDEAIAMLEKWLSNHRGR